MIPSDSISDFTIETEPSYTYRLDIENNRIRGMCDKAEAMKQAIYKILKTERYKSLIYSWNYGSEFEPLYGKQISLVKSRLYSVIKEALLSDERIKSVSEFTVKSLDKRSLEVSFTAGTIFGDIDITKEVAL